MRRESCAVLVAGGGVAGAAAAISAARAGAATILVEREATLGGIGQLGLLRRICGLYRNGGELPGTTLNTGFARELAARLGTAPERVGQVWLQPLGEYDLDRLFAEFSAAEPQLQVRRGHAVTAVTGRGGTIRAVTTDGPAGPRQITPAVVVDATGDGNLAVMAGAASELSPPGERQLAGFTVRFRGLSAPGGDLALQVPFACATFTPGAAGDDGDCKLSIPGEAPDRDRQARAAAATLKDYLATALPAFRQATITALSPRVLDREGRRIVGDYQLTADDILAACTFPDRVARNAWPMESWERERGTVYRYGPAGGYEIPFRCLRVRGFANLLTAGRCVSVSREALASTRVMGCCLALGAAAGRAAAFHAVHGSYPPEFSV
jgi:hypothetical protein